MKINKKYTLLSFGTIMTIITPAAVVVSCGSKEPKEPQPAEVKFNFDSKAHSILAAKAL